MPEFPVEGPRIRLDATSVVNRVMEWGKNAEGKRFKTETQARHPDTGMPMYAVEVLHRRVNFGEDFTATCVVEVGAPERPDPAPMNPVVFEGLEVSIYKNPAGGLTEKWRAEAIADMQQRPGPRTEDAGSTSSGKDTTSTSSKASSGSPTSSSSAAA